MQHLKLFRMPLSQGVGFSGLLSNRVWQDPLLHSQMAQGWIFSSHPARATQTDVSVVGVLLTLLENALSLDSKHRAKTPIPIIETRARNRLFRSSEGRSISPPLQSFLMAHQSWRVHFLSTASPLLYYLTLVHHIVSLVQNLVQKWVWISIAQKGHIW
jgi:hypothetical protein